MKIGMILRQYPSTKESPILPETIRQLAARGVAVTPIYPESTLTDLAQVEATCDLYVLKSGADLALSLGGALHAAGATLVNPYPVTAMLRDKIVTTRRLQSYDVPAPNTYTAASFAQLEPLLAEGPLVVKPYKGSQGQGVRVVKDAAALYDAPPPDGPLFAQRYHPPDGPDYKIYCIGDQIFGVRRAWPAVTYQDKVGEPFPITPEMRQITLRCGQAFGITLFGIDIVYSHGRPYVVDMSSFPGFKGVANAALRLAEYIDDLGRQVMSRAAIQPATR